MEDLVHLYDEEVLIYSMFFLRQGQEFIECQFCLFVNDMLSLLD